MLDVDQEWFKVKVTSFWWMVAKLRESLSSAAFRFDTFTANCKRAEDDAIALINACGDERTVIIGNFRSLINDLEDEAEEEDYDEDDDDFNWIHDFD